MRKFITHKRDLLLIVCGALLVISFVVTVHFFAQISFAYQAALCDYKNTSEKDKNSCWITLLNRSLQHGGTTEMIRGYTYLRNQYAGTLTAEDCHTYTHWMGDMLYYEMLSHGEDTQTVEFPKEASVCTFGIIHGFFIHLFESHPTEQFITTTCNYFGKRFSNTFPTMEEQCYHAAGHGFIFTNAQGIPSGGADSKKLILSPLEHCDMLSSTTQIQRETCYQGAFSQLFEWTAAKYYGLTFDESEPFNLCDSLRAKWRGTCYDQVADRLFRKPNVTISTLAAHVAPITDVSLRVQAFRQAMRILILRAIVNSSYTSLVPECGIIPHNLFQTCIREFTHALFNAGFPDEQYKKARVLCASNEMALIHAEEICYQSIAKQLARFYTDEELSQFDDPKVIDAIEKLRKDGKLTTIELDASDTQ